MYVLFPLKVGILEQNLKQRDTFYENVFKHGFLFELSHWEQIYGFEEWGSNISERLI